MWIIWLIASLLCLTASAYFSGSEMGLYCVNRLRLRLQAGQAGSTASQILQRQTQRQQETVLAILLGNNLANYLLTVTTALFLVEITGLGPPRIEFMTAAVLSPLVFSIGDVIPKNWFRIEADRLMTRFAPLLKVVITVFRWTGILWILQRVTSLSARLAGKDRLAEQTGGIELQGPRGEVLGLLREGAAEGALTADQTQIIERVMNLSNVRLGAIMIPRRHVAAVPVDTPRGSFKNIVRGCNYSRLVVLGKNRKTVAGIVDVLDVLADETESPVENWMYPALNMNASETVAKALVQLQRAHANMAIVTDPRRGFVGIVTLKDVVEEIFGELHAW